LPSSALTAESKPHEPRASGRNPRRPSPNALQASGRPQAHPRPRWQRSGTADPRAQPDGTLVKALARAWCWQRQLDAGVYVSLAEIAAAEKLSPSYVSRIARPALLAPDLVEAIQAGMLNQGVVLERLEKGVSVDWEEQRAACKG
jgi:hypothetical protein